MHAFAKGASLALADTPPSPPPSTAINDVCLVKLNVGPGNPGPSPACASDCPGPACQACVPSTSAGIGIEVWLPSAANWNHLLHNLGGSHWAGGAQASLTRIGDYGAAFIAGSEGAVSGTTDTGHAITDGSFAMDPDGSINSTLWSDFAERSLHQLALQTKALAAGFYSSPPQYSYWEGCSTGGRQGYNVAQNHPTDYNGYLIGAPAINWTRFETAGIYAQIVIQRDLLDHGLALTPDQENFVSRQAVNACDKVGGLHMGYIPDPRQCHYDPVNDDTVSCAAPSPSPGCVTIEQAAALDKFWYGQTTDGTAPDPAGDNGTAPDLAAGQLWYGQTRGTDLIPRASPGTPYPYSSDMTALELQDPAWAESSFVNASGNGLDMWRALSYSQFANAADQGLALQSQFANINTDNTDLSGIRDSGAKIIHYHGLADPLITPLGSIRYYTQMSAAMGGLIATQQFDRLYLIPGMGHCSGSGTVRGTRANDANVPLPTTLQLYSELRQWVESGTAPDAIVLQSQNQAASQPVCVFPKLAGYTGPDPAKPADVTAAANYSCK